MNILRVFTCELENWLLQVHVGQIHMGLIFSHPLKVEPSGIENVIVTCGFWGTLLKQTDHNLSLQTKIFLRVTELLFVITKANQKYRCTSSTTNLDSPLETSQLLHIFFTMSCISYHFSIMFSERLTYSQVITLPPSPNIKKKKILHETCAFFTKLTHSSFIQHIIIASS